MSIRLPTLSLACSSFVYIERLRQVIICSCIQTVHQILFVVSCSQKKNVRISKLLAAADPAAELDSVDSWHNPIQDQKLRRISVFQNLPRLQSVLGSGDPVFPLAKPAFKNAAEERIIFSHQDRIRLHRSGGLCREFLVYSRKAAH